MSGDVVIVGIRPCGHGEYACSRDHVDLDELIEMLDRGLTLKSMTVEAFRAMPNFLCDCPEEVNEA